MYKESLKNITNKYTDKGLYLYRIKLFPWETIKLKKYL